MSGPQRIVCLTEEPTEVLYALGEEQRIVGISGFTVRPPRARREKPKVSAFTSAKIEQILQLRPDFVNHRSVAEILDYIHRLGALVGAADKSAALVQRARAHLAHVEAAAQRLPRRPRVYFEEWDEPMISGIRWVAELIRVAGGDDVFPELAEKSLARDRIIADAREVVRRAPDIIIGSWCGKKFRADTVSQRDGWGAIPAVRDRQLFEVKSPLILQPGPAALFDGLDALHRIVAAWANAAG
jgi:iron complex transport system substrate-binding protein